MKIFRVVSTLSVVIAFLVMGLPGRSCAESPNTTDVAAKISRQDAGVKASIIEKKQKIKAEREGILAAGKKLREAKKTRNKATIEQVKREVGDEIAKRKAAISILKDEIEVMQEGKESMAPGRMSRADEG